MTEFSGKSVYKGITMGKVLVLKNRDFQIKRTKVEDAQAEIDRVDAAGEQAKAQLKALYDKAVKEVGKPVQLFLKYTR